jgi:SAM-dependent methyltransferase
MAVDEARRDELVGRLFNSTIGAFDLVNVYLGERLGLYSALAEGGPQTVDALALRAGVHERYAREWLEHQAATGLLDTDGTDSTRTFALPEAHQEVLLDKRSLNYVAPFARMLVAIGRRVDGIADAYRSGGGVPWADYGEDMITAQADVNRPMFEQLLAAEWLPAVPSIEAALTAGGANAADIACGAGWSSIAIGQAYPGVRVDGYDYDPLSIDLARKNAVDAGVQERVRFHGADVSESPLAGQYDLATIFEALHDMSRPVDALRSARSALKPDGALLVMDERAEPEFAAPAGEVERLLYGYSTLICLVNSMAEPPSAALGTVLRESTVRGLATEAGFSSTEVLPIEHDFFRFYLMRP